MRSRFSINAFADDPGPSSSDASQSSSAPLMMKLVCVCVVKQSTYYTSTRCSFPLPMHNVKRVPVATLSPQVLEQRRIEEEHRLNTYKQVEKKYLEHVSVGEGDILTGQISESAMMVRLRPWTVHRHCLLAIPNITLHGITEE